MTAPRFPHFPPPNHFRTGLTLIECMLLIMVLSIVAVSASVGLQSVSRSPNIIENRLWIANQLSSKLESLRDSSYAALVSGTATSDPDLNNITYTITWTVLEIDPAAPTSPTAKANSGLKQITITLGSQTLITWISQ